MKFTFSFLALIVGLSANAGVVGGIAPIKKMEGRCDFADNESLVLGFEAYTNGKTPEISFALVTIYQYADKLGNKRALEKFRLKYVPPANPNSWIYNFENKEIKVGLEVFGDDVGRMSSLTRGRQTHELSCHID